MVAPRLVTIALSSVAILTLAACAGDSSHKLAELDKLDAMSCPELAAYRAHLTDKVPEAEVMEIAKATVVGGAMLGAMVAVGPLAILGAPLVTAADTDLGARATSDLTEVRRLEVYRCPKNGVMKASAAR